MDKHVEVQIALALPFLMELIEMMVICVSLLPTVSVYKSKKNIM